MLLKTNFLTPTCAVQAVCVTHEYPGVCSLLSDGKGKSVLWVAVPRACPGASICLCRTEQHACIHVLTTTLTFPYFRHTHAYSWLSDPAHRQVWLDTGDHGLTHAPTLTPVSGTMDTCASETRSDPSCCTQAPAHTNTHTLNRAPLTQEKLGMEFKEKTDGMLVFFPMLVLPQATIPSFLYFWFFP